MTTGTGRILGTGRSASAPMDLTGDTPPAAAAQPTRKRKMEEAVTSAATGAMAAAAADAKDGATQAKKVKLKHEAPASASASAAAAAAGVKPMTLTLSKVKGEKGASASAAAGAAAAAAPMTRTMSRGKREKAAPASASAAAAAAPRRASAALQFVFTRDAFVHIASFLSIKEMARIGRVCRVFNAGICSGHSILSLRIIPQRCTDLFRTCFDYNESRINGCDDAEAKLTNDHEYYGDEDERKTHWNRDLKQQYVAFHDEWKKWAVSTLQEFEPKEYHSREALSNTDAHKAGEARKRAAALETLEYLKRSLLALLEDGSAVLSPRASANSNSQAHVDDRQKEFATSIRKEIEKLLREKKLDEATDKILQEGLKTLANVHSKEAKAFLKRDLFQVVLQPAINDLFTAQRNMWRQKYRYLHKLSQLVTRFNNGLAHILTSHEYGFVGNVVKVHGLAQLPMAVMAHIASKFKFDPLKEGEERHLLTEHTFIALRHSIRSGQYPISMGTFTFCDVSIDGQPFGDAHLKPLLDALQHHMNYVSTMKERERKDPAQKVPRGLHRIRHLNFSGNNLTKACLRDLIQFTMDNQEISDIYLTGIKEKHLVELKRFLKLNRNAPRPLHTAPVAMSLD